MLDFLLPVKRQMYLPPSCPLKFELQTRPWEVELKGLRSEVRRVFHMWLAGFSISPVYKLQCGASFRMWWLSWAWLLVTPAVEFANSMIADNQLACQLSCLLVSLCITFDPWRWWMKKVFVFLVCVLVFQLPHMTGSEKRGNFTQNANFFTTI